MSQSLAQQVESLEARVTFDAECVRLLLSVKNRVWGEACYDPFNESTRQFAALLMSDLQALCDRLKINT